jgi:hypothetical protein
VTVLSPRVDLVLMDETGSTAALSVHLAPGSTVTAADASATALASVVVSITGCVLVKQRIVYKSVVDDPDTAAAGSSIARAGVFYFDTATDQPDAVITVPSIDEATLVATEPGSGVLIDLENANVIAFIDELFAQGVTSQFGDEITAIVTAYRQSRV